MKQKSEFLTITNELRGIGLTITKKLSTGEFRVNFANGKEGTAYYTDCLQDARNTGLLMGKELKGEK